MEIILVKIGPIASVVMYVQNIHNEDATVLQTSWMFTHAYGYRYKYYEERNYRNKYKTADHDRNSREAAYAERKDSFVTSSNLKRNKESTS